MHRNTKQRKDVFDSIKGENRHFTAEQLMKIMEGNNKKVGLATLYRNLNHLYENGMIGRINNDGVVLYDGNPEPHDHLHCTVCNKFYDVPKIDIDKENVNNAGKILNGSININPYIKGNENSCTYCQYNSVCGFSTDMPGTSYRRLSNLSKEDIWKLIDENNSGEAYSSSKEHNSTEKYNDSEEYNKETDSNSEV